MDLVTGALGAGARFWMTGWRRAWLTLGLGIAAGALSGAGDVGAWARSLGAVLVLMAIGALWRAALGVGRAGPGGLQLGAIELRLAISGLLSVVFLGIVFLLALIVILAFAYAAAASGHGFVAGDISTWAKAADARGRVVMGLAAAACAVGWLWTAERIALAGPATVARGKVQVLATWPLTRRRVAPILLVQVATGLLLALAIASWRLAPGTLGRAVAAVLSIGLWLPLTIGAHAYLFDNLESRARPIAS